MRIMNEIVQFNQQHLEAFKSLSNITKQKKELEKQEKEVKEFLQGRMEEFGIDKIDNQYMTITRVKESESVTIDLKTLEKKENTLYDELLRDYPKFTKRKAHLMFKVK